MQRESVIGLEYHAQRHNSVHQYRTVFVRREPLDYA